MSAEGEMICPLCLEEMDVTDKQLKPCKCGYEVCVWCWHHIMDTAEKDGTEGICPACRSPYDKERILGKTISSNRLEELNTKKRKKLQKSKSKVIETRAHLSSCRVIQRNLVYLAGIPVNIAEQKILQKKEFLGQYGKVLKIAMTKASTAEQQFLSPNSRSVFVTFAKVEEAIRCIQALNGFIFDGKPLRASFGTTKYCEAWLKNTPCENPHCVYLHDAGQQEDICTREDVISACASKIHQSCGTTFDKMQRHSGRFFPPPTLSYDINAPRNGAIANPMLRYPVDFDRNKAPDGDCVKYGVNFNEASGSLKVSSSMSSSKSTLIQGAQVNKPTIFGCSLVPNNSMEPDGSMKTPGTHQNRKQEATPRNHLPHSGEVTGDFSSLNLWEKIGLLSMERTGPTVGLCSVVEGCINESSYIHERTSKQCCADCRLVRQQLISMHEGVVQCSSTGDTSASMLHSWSNSTNFDSERNLVQGGQTVTLKSKGNYASLVEALCPGLEPCGSISQDIKSNYQQYAFPCRESMSSADDLEARSMFLSESQSRETFASNKRSTTHFMGNMVNYDRSCSVIGPKSSKVVHHNMGDMSSVHEKDKSALCHVEYGCHITSLEKPMVQNTCESERVRRDATEENIISDILSLDIVLDDPSLDANLGKLLLDENGETSFCSNVIGTWKSRNSNSSRFCFARLDNSVRATKETFSHGIDECEHNLDLNKLKKVKNHSVCQTQSNNLKVSDSVFSKGTDDICHCLREHTAEPKLHSSLYWSALPPLPQPTSASSFGFENRPLCFRPHDFFPQYTAYEDHSISMFSDSGSSAFSQHAGNLAHLSSQRIPVENSCTHINYLCPSVTTFSHIPQSSSMDSLDHRVSRLGLNTTWKSVIMEEEDQYNMQNFGSK